VVTVVVVNEGGDVGGDIDGDGGGGVDSDL
jgi:hypothetical protein